MGERRENTHHTRTHRPTRDLINYNVDYTRSSRAHGKNINGLRWLYWLLAAGCWLPAAVKKPRTAGRLVSGAAGLRLLLAELEVLAPLNDELLLLLALLAFQAEGDLLRGLRLFVEHRLCLPPEPLLYS